MDEITFSIFNHSVAASAQMTRLLKQFEQEENIRVRLEVIHWGMGWQRLVEMGLYHLGADISEIGSTWIMDFVRMEALRPYSTDEIREITGEQRFFEAAWAGGVSGQPDKRVIWAMPMAGDARAIFYRRDWLAKAGVDEEVAFKGPSRFDHTLAAIQKAGCSMPLSLPTGRSRNNLHSLASWVWGLGGDFLSADGSHIEFDRQQALDGFKAYFSLGRYLGTRRIVEETDSDAAFSAGHGATTISGYWILHGQKAEEVEKNLSLDVVPGIPFVGGEHLIIWRHSRHPEHALKLAKFLTRPEISSQLFPLFGLPVTPAGWANAPFTEPQYDVFHRAMQKGRNFPTSPLWGLVEKRLSDLLPDIWTEVLARPERVDSIVENYLGSLARRLQLTLKS